MTLSGFTCDKVLDTSSQEAPELNIILVKVLILLGELSFVVNSCFWKSLTSILFADKLSFINCKIIFLSSFKLCKACSKTLLTWLFKSLSSCVCETCLGMVKFKLFFTLLFPALACATIAVSNSGTSFVAAFAAFIPIIVLATIAAPIANCLDLAFKKFPILLTDSLISSYENFIFSSFLSKITFFINLI